MANVCRSPMAVAVLQHQVREAGLASDFKIDAAGTHAQAGGKPPDARTVRALAARQYKGAKSRSRQVTARDFERYDLVLAMDAGNLAALTQQCPPQHRHKLRLFLSFSPELEMAEVPDPYFGNQPPEPSEAHIPDMIARMKQQSFDLGLATDGDADRFGVLGPHGVFYEPNQILGMVLDHMKNTRNWPGAAARSVATTHLVDAVARYHNIELIETPVGFKFLGDLIAQDKIIMGGEESAGMSIKGHVPEKDGIIACLLVAEMVAMLKKPIAEILSDLYEKVGTYVTRRLNFKLSEAEKAKAIANMKNDPKEVAGFKVKKVIRVDGTKCVLENDAWVLVRFSGTEPVVRFYAEARDEETLQQLCSQGEAFVKGS